MLPSSTIVLAHGMTQPGFDALTIFTQSRPALVPLLLVLLPAVLYTYGSP